MTKPKIVGIGEIVWDMLPSGKRLGGAPVNFAFYAQELGGQSYFITAVGNDELGQELLEDISALGLDTSSVQINDYPTSKVEVSLSKEGIPMYNICQNVAWDFLTSTQTDKDLVSDAAAVCWGSLAQRSEQSKKSILDILSVLPSNCLKVFDINIRQHYYSLDVIHDSLKKADVLKLNEDELPLVAELFSIKGDTKQIIETLIPDYKLSYVVYTRGAEYSEVYAADGSFSHIDTPKVKVADTVGAGDSFTAAFIASLLQGLPLKECHKKAVEISAFVCTQNGAMTPLPKNMK